MIIYKATNKINGKYYIGQTIKPIKTRISQHKTKSKTFAKQKKTNVRFYNAINKYGFSNFDWDIIDTASTIDELNQKEIYHIAITSAYICDTLGYNMTSGGGGISGYKHKQELKDRFSKELIGENNPNWNNYWTVEQKENLSKIKKGTFLGSKHPNWGKITPPEVRKKISLGNKKKKHSLKQKQIWSITRTGCLNSNYGNVYNEKTLEKMRKTQCKFNYVFKKIDGTLIEISSIKQYADNNNLSSTSLYRLVSGRYKKYKDFIFISKTLIKDKLS